MSASTQPSEALLRFKPNLNVWLVLVAVSAVGLLSPAGLRAFHVHAEFLTYTTAALELPRQLSERLLDRYYIGRVFPSAVAYGAVQALRRPHDLPNTLLIYSWINLVLTASIVATYCRIADQLHFNVREKLLGFVSLFGGFLLLHHFPYVPPTTDTWGCLLTLLMLSAHLARRRWLLYAVLVVGTFTWPTILLGCLLLLVFPYSDELPTPLKPTTRILAWATAGIAFLFWLLSAGYMLAKGLPTARIFQVETLPLAPLAIGVVAVYLIPGLALILMDNRLFDWKSNLKQLFSRTTLGPLLTVVATTAVKAAFSQSGGQNLKIYWGTHVAQTPLFKPGNFLLAATLFWGPVFILLILSWPKTVAALRKTGIALPAYLAAGVLATLHADSRMSMSFVPIAVLFAIKPIAAAARGCRSLLVLVAGTILTSKVWLEFGWAPSGTPADWWWGTYGTWMTNRMYMVQGAVILPLSVWLLYEFWPRKSGLPPRCARQPVVD